MSTHANSCEEEDDDFIKVIEKEDSEFMEFPKEEDDTVLLRTIQTQFADAIGIKYKGSSGAWRAVREVDNALVPPKGGWGDRIYSLTFCETKKRKGDSMSTGEKDAKYNKTYENILESDLAVIGLPYKTTENEFKEYFENKYGEVLSAQIKLDRETGGSRGFGFIRFKDEESAKEALNGEDYMDGRRIYVRPKNQKPMKMYVNGLPEGTTQEDLVEYFSQFGKVIDSHVPTPFRSFAFFTFSSTEDGRKCLREQHTFRDAQLKVRVRREKEDESNRDGHHGVGNSTGRGGYRNTSFTGGYNNSTYDSRNGQQGYRGRNTHSQPPPKDQAAADLKNMLVEFLTGPN